MCKSVVLFLVAALNLKQIESLSFFDEYDNPLVAERYSQFSCFKLKSCTPGPPQVCGYDGRINELAEFKDLCLLYKVNCQGKAFYKEIDMSNCKMKKDMMASKNQDQFEFTHINRTLLYWQRKPKETTTEATTPRARIVPGLVKLVQITNK